MELNCSPHLPYEETWAMKARYSRSRNWIQSWFQNYKTCVCMTSRAPDSSVEGKGRLKVVPVSPPVTGVSRKGGEQKGVWQAHKTVQVAPDISGNCQHQESTQASLIPAKGNWNGWQPPLTSHLPVCLDTHQCFIAINSSANCSISKMPRKLINSSTSQSW